MRATFIVNFAIAVLAHAEQKSSPSINSGT
jgi:hypothetical protein